MQTHEIIVAPQELSDAIQQGQSKGWQLAESVPQDNGNIILRFQRAQQYFQPGYGPQKIAVNPDTAWLELLGLLGFLGIGYMVADRVEEGVIRLIGFIFFSIIGWIVTLALTAVVIGICLIPVMFGLQIGIPIWSALTLRKELQARAMQM